MGSGKIVSVIGAVIDVEFPREEVPQVYDALKIDESGVTLEVQQQLGDGVVRTIAMGSSEGIARGLGVSNTNAPISVPVGEATLGRIMDVLGNPIDEAGPINETERLPIHRDPPSFEEQAGGRDLLETGVKVIDLICPFAKGGKGYKGTSSSKGGSYYSSSGKGARSCTLRYGSLHCCGNCALLHQ